MLRYVAIATVLVLAVAIVVGAWWARMPHKPLQVASVTASPAGPRGASSENGNRVAMPAVVSADWALSAAPDCLDELSIARGSVAFVRKYLPNGARELPAGTTLHYGDCTLRYDGRAATLLRGKDRLTVPAPSTLYADGNRLYLLHREPVGAQLRAYGPSDIPSR